ncbi:hypothetical protein [Pragia fontium]|uniref:Lipoprotein n=2 Tax=Pragia fontium TaxID=82985 RepID=A0AAJ5BH31_9GAMM|nr:hypothetical protein [Pragia fontium]GKX61440.1 hypothetical protein SOASR032_00090 [Pragia fontium]SFC76953.1 hypothetical protein SAMN02745723_10476 [Pragia fontium DSM 5563 = ATCC 49100]VEJ55658.1 Uncharacterised protein [Pragia fontium]
MFKYYYFKIVLLLLSLFLSGCIVNVNPLEDYTGHDMAMIRVKNYYLPLSIIRYQKIGSCIQRLERNSLTAGINILGIKSTYNKKIVGMPPSPVTSQLKRSDVMEYTIKADQPVMITYEKNVGGREISSTNSFIPQSGHSYEIFTVGITDNIIVTDITQGKDDQPAKWDWDLKGCEY